jgi:hypothetical protein
MFLSVQYQGYIASRSLHQQEPGSSGVWPPGVGGTVTDPVAQVAGVQAAMTQPVPATVVDVANATMADGAAEREDLMTGTAGVDTNLAPGNSSTAAPDIASTSTQPAPNTNLTPPTTPDSLALSDDDSTDISPSASGEASADGGA